MRYRNIAELQEGRGFPIVELNGAGAQMLHIWAGIGTLRGGRTTLWRQYQDLFTIGARMQRRGHRSVGAIGMLTPQRRQDRLRRSCLPRS